MIKELKNYHNAIDALANKFVEIYYGEADPEWTDGSGSCLLVGDYYWSMSDIENALTLKISEDKLFEYYDLRLDAGMKDEGFQNMKTFAKYGLIK